MKSHALLVALGLIGMLNAAPANPLALTSTIPLPHVEGRIDHLTIDPARGRLYVAALGNDTVEVVDLQAGRVAHTIKELAEPQGVWFAPAADRLFVANGGDGTVRAFVAATLAAAGTVKFSGDADNLRFDAAAHLLYVGFGDGALGLIDVEKNVAVGEIPLGAHPESFQLEQNGPRVFVNVPQTRSVLVVDRLQRKVVSRWSLGEAGGNFPLALDEPHHRLFVGCRSPACLIVLDTASGREIARVKLHGDCDDPFYDAKRRRVYASCSEGFIDVLTCNDADHYGEPESVATVTHARTCCFDGDRLYLAVPQSGSRGAEVRVYDVR